MRSCFTANGERARYWYCDFYMYIVGYLYLLDFFIKLLVFYILYIQSLSWSKWWGLETYVIQTPRALEILTCIYFYENVCCVYFESCHFVIFVVCIDISKVLFLCSRNRSSKLSNIFHLFLGYFIHISYIYVQNQCMYIH